MYPIPLPDPQVSPPLNRGAAAEALKQVEVRKADYTKLQAEARLRGEEEEPISEEEVVEEASESTPAAEPAAPSSEKKKGENGVVSVTMTSDKKGNVSVELKA